MMDECVFTDPLPTDPCALLGQWLETGRRHSGQRNWNTMYLATAAGADTGDGGGSGNLDRDIQPGVRAVLHKTYDSSTGFLTFYTNYQSSKALDIKANPRVSALIHWDELQRQIRIDGLAEMLPADESDAYFASRDRESQIGAWASEQSRPVDGWETLLERVVHYATRFGSGPVPRPPYWGGYRIIPHRFEFWHGRGGRIHERLEFVRDEKAESGWKRQWLYP